MLIAIPSDAPGGLDATTSEQRIIRSVYNCVHFEVNNITFDEIDVLHRLIPVFLSIRPE